MWLFGSFSRVLLLSVIHPNNYDNLTPDHLTIKRENEPSTYMRKNAEFRNKASAYKVETYALQGARRYMEDECFVSQDGRLCAIFDGHGGSAVSRFVRSNFFNHFQKALAEAIMETRGESQRQVKENETSAESGGRDLNITMPCNASNIHYIERNFGEEQVHSNRATNQLCNYTFPSIRACQFAFRTAFRNMDREILRVSRWRLQGTTAVAVLIHEEGEDRLTARRNIITVNIGDSRAVLSRRGIAVD